MLANSVNWMKRVFHFVSKLIGFSSLKWASPLRISPAKRWPPLLFYFIFYFMQISFEWGMAIAKSSRNRVRAYVTFFHNFESVNWFVCFFFLNCDACFLLLYIHLYFPRFNSVAFPFTISHVVICDMFLEYFQHCCKTWIDSMDSSSEIRIRISSRSPIPRSFSQY